MSPATSTTERVLRAATCALIPGPCVVEAVRAANTVAGDAQAVATQRAQLAATAAAAGMSSGGGGILNGLERIVDASAAPVESQASAARYVSVAVAIAVVAMVIGAIVLAVRLT